MMPLPATYKRLLVLLAVLAMGSALASPLLPQAPAVNAQTPDEPSTITVTGTVAEALGCLDIECAASQLTFDPDDLVWQAELTLPPGDYSYQVVLDGDSATARPAEPRTFRLDEETTVKFYYDHRTGWAADSVSSLIANVPGTIQQQLGCPASGGNEGNWQPWCLRTLLTDPDGDGLYTFSTDALSAGRYEVKVAYNESWGENYGADGQRDGSNIAFRVTADGNPVLFIYDPETHILTIETEAPPPGDLTTAQAHWIFADQIVWDVPFSLDGTYRLHWDPDGALRLAEDGSGVVGGQSVVLKYTSDRANIRVLDERPYLANKAVLELPEEALPQVPDILKGQVVVSLEDVEGQLVDATTLQIPLVLDDLYRYDGSLGVTFDAEGVPTIRVWAPTARQVNVLLFDDSVPDTSPTILPMDNDPATGVWEITGEVDWRNKFYLFEVEVYVPSTGQVETNRVTDPYSFGLSLNSQRSQIVDLNDPALLPDGWAMLDKPALAAPEDIVIYELHVRDFSIYDESVPEALRGTYLAFAQPDSNGMQHLRALAEAGLTHLHLLPTFDIATINENAGERVFWPRETFADYGPAAEEPQAIIDAERDADGFNWGYDPYHYTVPEGSYSTDPDGTARIIEFRQMVQALNQAGLRVVVDVVYNHTNAAGQAEKSVLDKIVPGYYHRLSPRGQVETSTCCFNTATEHRMMEKLMIDSVLTWATAYKVDGFRFDLMGHHMLRNMQNVRAALDELTLADDGVDGSQIYVYGEGWDFGEVANGERGANATQFNTPGTGIGTFNDRLRDAARGGNPFGGYQEQGFINGLYTAPNGVTPGTPEEQLARLLLFSDQIRVGLAGNLRDYTFIDRTGAEVTGTDIDYNGQPVGYTLDPQEHIVYVSAHDNETLFDAIQYKAPPEADIATRVRMQNLGISLVAFSQGVPFYHAGIDLLRSKSFDRDSYNSGDWFNFIDWTYTDNGFGRGLPIADKNQDQWDIQRPLLENTALHPAQDDILGSANHFREVLRIRKSSGLFRLPTAEAVQQNLHFLNTGPDQTPGVIVMVLENNSDLADELYQTVVVVFNATPGALSYSADELAGTGLSLHPIQQESADAVVRTATFDDASGTFSVPAYTTAVFVAE